MLKNFFTTNSDSESAHRLYIILFIGWIAVSLFVSYLVFYLNPQFYYFRAWEYFEDILYPNPNVPQVWDGFEKGDYSRKFIFSFQDKYFTHVTTDCDGFRSVPYLSDNYQVVVYGDSSAFGSGLSDSETFPWRLAIESNIPVFNAARHGESLASFLNKPNLKNVKLIVHNISFGTLEQTDAFFRNDFPRNDYIPMKDYYKSNLSIRRLLVPDISRIIKAAKYELIFRSGLLNSYMCNRKYSGSIDEIKINKYVERIYRFSKQFADHGIKYVLVPVPDRDLICADEYDNASAQDIYKLSILLKKRGVHVVDLTPAFLANRGRGLFFKSDSHWNDRGTEVASKEAVKYLEVNGLLNGLQTVHRN